MASVLIVSGCPAFADLGKYEAHAFDTTRRSVEAVANEIRSRRVALLLDPTGEMQ